MDNTLKLDSIMDNLKILTLFEVSELVTEIEKTFNVDTSLAMGGMMMAPSSGMAGTVAPDKPSEENEASAKTEEQPDAYKVILESIPEKNRLQSFKIIRQVKNLQVAEVKEFTKNLPQTLSENLTKEDAEKLKKQLDEINVVSKISS